MRQYEREDVDFTTWYSEWSKRLALLHTMDELIVMRDGKKAEAATAAQSHLRAIERTSSMQSNSAARANTRNSAAAAGDARFALSGAIEIHELFPEFAKGFPDRNRGASEGEAAPHHEPASAESARGTASGVSAQPHHTKGGAA